MELKAGTLELKHRGEMWWLDRLTLEGRKVDEAGPFNTRFEAILIGANIAIDQHLVFDGGWKDGHDERG